MQGTRGLFQGYPDRVYIEGHGRPEHQWEEAKTYLAQYDHPLWSELTKKAEGAGHGGMDYLEDYRLIKCLLEGVPTDMNVYDAAALSAVVQLTERSNARRSAPSTFPTSRAAAGKRSRRGASCARDRAEAHAAPSRVCLSVLRSAARNSYIISPAHSNG